MQIPIDSFSSTIFASVKEDPRCIVNFLQPSLRHNDHALSVPCVDREIWSGRNARFSKPYEVPCVPQSLGLPQLDCGTVFNALSLQPGNPTLYFIPKDIWNSHFCTWINLCISYTRTKVLKCVPSVRDTIWIIARILDTTRRMHSSTGSGINGAISLVHRYKAWIDKLNSGTYQLFIYRSTSGTIMLIFILLIFY